MKRDFMRRDCVPWEGIFEGFYGRSYERAYGRPHGDHEIHMRGKFGG
jgi:hypothetical protein